MQKHNEEKLNKAYDTCGAVYLIFSVNGRGNFQGWARMTSKITHGQVSFAEHLDPQAGFAPPDLFHNSANVS